MICSEALVASITALAVAIAEGKEEEELELFSCMLTMLADTLATIAATRSLQ